MNESKPVRKLRVGDVVRVHGLECRVVDPPARSSSHDNDHHDAFGGVWYTRAVVTNRHDVGDVAVPYAFTAAGNGQHRWTLQGNDLALFRVESVTDDA